MMKRWMTLFCVLLLAAGVLAGCKSDVKKFSAAGMQITLNGPFEEQPMEGLTSCYRSENVMVTVLKEDFSAFEEQGLDPADYSLTDYAQLVQTANMVSGEIQEKGGVTYFTYDKTSDGTAYTYYETVHQALDAFWLISFVCEKEDYETLLPDFQKWAKSVKFDKQK